MKIGRLFVGSAPTNVKDQTVVASWSYVTGYWRWVVWRSPWRSWRCGFGGSYGDGRHFTPGGGRLRHPFSCNLWIPLVGAFNISTQPPLPAMKTWR